MFSKNSEVLKSKRVKFGDVVRLNTDRVTDPLNAGIERYVGLEHITSEDLQVHNWGLVVEGTTFTNLFKPGQVLFGKRRAYQRKVAVAEFEGVCSGDIYVFEPKDDQLLPELLPFICQSDAFFEHAVGTSAGSLSPRTNWEQLAKYEFALPPMDEQHKFAHLFTSINNLKSALLLLEDKCLDLQASQVEAILQHKSCKWPELPITHMCNVVTGKLDSNAAVSDGTYPFFTCDPIVHRINSYAFDCEAIILAGNNAQGNFWVKKYRGKFNAYQRTYVLTAIDPENLNMDYLCIVIKRALRTLKAYSIGSVTKYLTMEILNKVSISVPPKDIQDAISSEFSIIENMAGAIRTRRQYLDSLNKKISILLLEASRMKNSAP